MKALNSRDNKGILLTLHTYWELRRNYQFLGNHKLSKLIQDETDNLNGPITIKWVEGIISNLSKIEFPGLCHSENNFTQILLENLEEGRILPK